MSERYFPFYKLGFRSNPFRTITRQEWADIAITPPQINSLLSKSLTHLQILGEQGRGKTTTLLALQHRFKEQGFRTAYEYLNPEQHSFQTKLLDLDLFLLDEFQRLSARQRSRLIRQIAHLPSEGLQLFFTSHEDLTHLFQAHVRPLTTVHLGRLDTTFLRALIERRLQASALDDHPQVAFSVQAIERLHVWFGGDLRSMEAFLYEVFQNLDRSGEISIEQLEAYKSQFMNGVAPG